MPPVLGSEFQQSQDMGMFGFENQTGNGEMSDGEQKTGRFNFDDVNCVW
jgi:hypothetical protein